MKQLSTYINEKLVLNKNTFKGRAYKYFPKTHDELKDIIIQLIKDNKDEDVIDLNDINTSEITDMSKLFYEVSEQVNPKNLKKIDISEWNVSKVTNMFNMFWFCGELKSVGDLSSWDVHEVTNMCGMFQGCDSLESIGDLSSWDISSVKYLHYMFYHCQKLKSIGDISDWDISSVTNMSCMFYMCLRLKSLGDLNKWKIINSELKVYGSGLEDMFMLSSITDLPSWYKGET